MKNPNRPAAPKYLSPAAKGWWKALHEEYTLDAPDQLLILEAALASFDRWQAAKAIVDKEGITISDRFQQKKQHPATLVERDAKLAMLRSLKVLGLDILPPEGA